MKLAVCEIIFSIQGETVRSGFPSVFVRLAGCNLNCRFCDTPGARDRDAGEEMSIDHILARVMEYPTLDHVTLTGGEPLLQEHCPELIERLLSNNLDVQVETNGSLSVTGIPYGVRKIVDVKTPSSGEAGSFLEENIEHMVTGDELKFVISDMADYRFAGDFISGHRDLPCVINLSPAHGAMEAEKLARLILDDNIPVRLNLQLHKYLGVE